MEESDGKAMALTCATVKGMQVIDRASYETMAQYVLLFDKWIKERRAKAKPRIEEAFKHHRALIADLNAECEPVEAAKKYGDEQLMAYDREQEKRAEIERRQLEALQKQRDEDEKLQLASLAEKAGNNALADDILTRPSDAPPIYVPTDTPKVEGLHYMESWKFEIMDVDEIPREYLMADITKIGRIVRALKQTTNIPGVRVWCEKTPVHRG